jgi:hypothetical protein
MATGATYWTNSDGLRVRFGPLGTADQMEYMGHVTSGPETVETYSIDFDKDHLQGYTNLVTNNDQGVVTIPAGAQLVNAWVQCLVAFTGTGVVDIGLEKASDGTDVDLDGLFDGIDIDVDLAATTDSLDMREHGGTNSGALLTDVLSAACVPQIVLASGTFTAGRGRLVVQYRKTGL